MIRRFITIDRTTYAVPSEEAFAELKANVLAAVLAGAGLIELPEFNGRTLSVMVSPHRAVVFEERADEEHDGYQITQTGVEFLGDATQEFSDFDY